MNEEMSEFLGVFLQEAADQIELLEQAILVLEHEPSQELLQEIFRAAHTLKGSSRAMGLTAMGELTHAMEDVFDRLRQNELAVSLTLINALFGGLDALKTMLEEIAADGSSTLDSAQLTALLRSLLSTPPAKAEGERGRGEQEDQGVGCRVSGVGENSLSDASSLPSSTWSSEGVHSINPGFPDTRHPTPDTRFSSACADALAAGLQLYSLTVEIAADCAMKSVRALMVLQALEHVGSLLATFPDEEGLENEAFHQSFEVIITTQLQPDALTAAAKSVAEIRSVEIAPWVQSAFIPEVLDTDAAPENALQPPSIPIVQSTIDNRQSTIAQEPAEQSKIQNPKSKIDHARHPTPDTRHPTVRVDVARLDSLLNLIGELVIDRTRITQLGGQLERQIGTDPLVESLNATAMHVARITDQLQEEIMKVRLLPVDQVFSRFPRMVRDLAQKLGKEISFCVEGEETELDRSVIEVIGDPLLHMLRNSVDHGVESPQERERAGKPRIGNIRLRARHQENHILIEIQDDGKGIDPAALRASAVRKGLMTKDAADSLSDKEAIHLIFASGFSTANEVSEISGRGVGMDIVRSNLQKLGATIDIESQVGIGTTISVKLPLTLAILRGLLVTVADNIYTLPLESVIETLRIRSSEMRSIKRHPVLTLRGRTLPLARMRDLFPIRPSGLPAQQDHKSRSWDDAAHAVVQTRPIEAIDSDKRRAEPAGWDDSELYVVVVGAGNRQLGLIVDALIGEQEVVIKTLGKFIGDIRGLAGATILGDGHMALITDIDGIFTMATEEKGVAYAA